MSSNPFCKLEKNSDFQSILRRLHAVGIEVTPGELSERISEWIRPREYGIVTDDGVDVFCKASLWSISSWSDDELAILVDQDFGSIG